MVKAKLVYLGNIKGGKGDKGVKGDTGTFAGATATTVPADQGASVTLTGSETAKVANFRIPRGLPGVNAVAADEAVATYLAAEDSETGSRARSLIIDGTLPVSPSDAQFDQFPTRTMETVSINNRTYQVSPIVTLPNGDYVAVWFDDNRHPIVGRYNVSSRSWETNNLHFLYGNPLGSPAPSDGHNSLVIARDGAGYLHIMGNMHADIMRYAISARPDDITGWLKDQSVSAWSTSVTYPNMLTLDNGDILAFYRTGGSNAGDWYLRRYAVTARAWDAPKHVFGRHLDGGSGSAYPNSIVVEGSSIHLFFMFRYTGTEDSNRDLSYVRSNDLGETWETVTGSAVTAPFRPDITSTRIRSGTLRMINQSGAAVVGGQPHMVARRTEGSSSYIEWIRWDGSSWVSTDVATASAGGVGRPAIAAYGSGGALIMYRRGGYPVARAVSPTLSNEFRLFPHTTGNTEAGWEPAFEAALMQRSGVLRAVVNSTVAGATNDSSTPVGPGGWGGVLTLRLSDAMVSKMSTSRSMPGVAAPILPPPTVNPFNSVPDANFVWFTTASNEWFTVGNSSRQTSGVPRLPLRQAHVVRTMFARQSRIAFAAVKVVTPGDAGSQIQMYVADEAGNIIGRSSYVEATSAGVKQVEFVTRAPVYKDTVYLIGASVWGGTTGVGLMLTGENDPRIGAPGSAQALDYVSVGWRESTPNSAGFSKFNSLAWSPFAPVVALRGIDPVAT